jgi:hypothetical protein
MEKSKKNEDRMSLSNTLPQIDDIQNLKDILGKAKKLESKMSENELYDKLPKEISDIMKENKDKTYPMKESIYYNDRTDFASRGKKMEIKFNLKGWFKGVINKIKKSKLVKWVKDTYKKIIVSPIKQINDEKNRKKFEIDTKKGFSKTFNVKHERMLKLMDLTHYDYDNSIKSKKAINDLSENAKHINNMRKYLAPTLYEPEIVELHNEFLNPDNPTIKEVKNEEYFKTEKLLEKQEKILNRKR